MLVHWVCLQQVPPPEDVDALTGLAAIVVAREMQEQPPSYKPGLHGTVRGQSHSVKAAMKTDRPVSSTHEEFERIIYNAVRWTRYALSGQTDVLKAQDALEMRLIDASVSVLETHNTTVMATFLSNLEGYATYCVNAIPRLVALKNATMQDTAHSDPT